MTGRVFQPIIIKLVKLMFAVTVILASSVVLIIFLSDNLHVRNKRQSHNSSDVLVSSRHKAIKRQQKVTFLDIITNNKVAFNITGQDLLVLLHIQKTGGTTFERHLVNDLDIEIPCSCSDDRRRCFCHKPNGPKNPKTVADSTWLISRFSTGWVCGLHADWTFLNECLIEFQRLFFITFLRHPLHRFISEFRHVQRGATWKASKGHCSLHKTQVCYGDRSNWINVSLEEFLNCPNNMAINRQTLMLADHNLVGCIGAERGNQQQARDSALLMSAMNNLRDIAFFGLCEKQRVSQMIFEKTFNLRFKEDFKQSEDNKTRTLIEKLPDDIKGRILKSNHLDLKLYDFAINLFRSRCKELFGSKCDDIWT